MAETKNSEELTVERQAQNVHIIRDEDIEIDLTGNEDTEKKQRTFRCKHCSAEFYSRRMLLSIHVCMKEPAAEKSTGKKNSGKEQSTEVVILTDEEEEGNDDDEEDDDEDMYGEHICPICLEPFTHKENLIIHHVKSHTNIYHLLNKREKPYGCDFCPSSYSKLQNLQVHMRSHTGERPFKCLDCPSTFVRKSNLKVHMRLHTGDKPFKCHICSAGFPQSESLNRHRIKCYKAQAKAKANAISNNNTNAGTSTDVLVTKHTDFCSNSGVCKH